jgi:hypothetical protein
MPLKQMVLASLAMMGTCIFHQTLYRFTQNQKIWASWTGSFSLSSPIRFRLPQYLLGRNLFSNSHSFLLSSAHYESCNRLSKHSKRCRPLIGPNTRVLAIMNGLGIEEALAETLSPAPIFGGMAFTCINRGEPGVVNHLKYGALQVLTCLSTPLSPCHEC